MKYSAPWEFDAYYTTNGRLVFRVLDADQNVICEPNTREDAHAIVNSRNNASPIEELEQMRLKYEKQFKNLQDDHKKNIQYFKNQIESLENNIYKIQNRINC